MRAKIMKRPIIPGLLILIGVISLSSLFYFEVPKVVVSTYVTTSILTAVAPEILLDYTTRTVSCTGVAPVCFVQVSPYTYTETWSAQTTPMMLVSSTSTTFVAYAARGLGGEISVLLILIILIGGIILFAKDWRKDSVR